MKVQYAAELNVSMKQIQGEKSRKDTASTEKLVS